AGGVNVVFPWTPVGFFLAADPADPDQVPAGEDPGIRFLGRVVYPVLDLAYLHRPLARLRRERDPAGRDWLSLEGDCAGQLGHLGLGGASGREGDQESPAAQRTDQTGHGRLPSAEDCQSLATASPPLGVAARCQVRALIDEETGRTLPAGRPAIATLPCRAWSRR